MLWILWFSIAQCLYCLYTWVIIDKSCVSHSWNSNRKFQIIQQRACFDDTHQNLLLCWCQPVKWNDGTNICLCMDQVSPLKTCISPVFWCQIVHKVWFFCSCVFFVDAVYKKHYPPALHDEVWRLDKIGKDGAFHKRLNKAGLYTVEDFLRLVVMDPQRLRNVSSCCMDIFWLLMLVFQVVGELIW